VRVRDVEELRDTVLERLQEIPAVRSTETVFVLDEDDLRDR
jgi:DNA-binding Lrp family transcriptional regulator